MNAMKHRALDSAAVPELKQVLADARREADVLRRAGNSGQADYIVALVERVERATREYLRELSFEEAQARSGWSERTLRRRFRELAACNLAGYSPSRTMWFRACAVPYQTSGGASEQSARDRGRDPTYKLGA
jgi:hypothetical protein